MSLHGKQAQMTPRQTDRFRSKEDYFSFVFVRHPFDRYGLEKKPENM